MVDSFSCEHELTDSPPSQEDGGPPRADAPAGFFLFVQNGRVQCCVMATAAAVAEVALFDNVGAQCWTQRLFPNYPPQERLTAVKAMGPDAIERLTREQRLLVRRDLVLVAPEEHTGPQPAPADRRDGSATAVVDLVLELMENQDWLTDSKKAKAFFTPTRGGGDWGDQPHRPRRVRRLDQLAAPAVLHLVHRGFPRMDVGYAAAV